MDSILRNFETNENFWVTNPAFLTVKLFKEFHSKDKSKDKSKSSRIMWAIAFYLDPHEHNVWRNLSNEDRKMLIADDYLKQKKFNWEDYQDIISEYYKRVLTRPEKDYYELVEKMTERKDFIKNTPYTLESYEEDPETGKFRTVKGTAKDLDSMVTNTIKLYEQLDAVKAKVERAKQLKGETKGGMEESATERGLL